VVQVEQVGWIIWSNKNKSINRRLYDWPIDGFIFRVRIEKPHLHPPNPPKKQF
jgi:hypothetical protein